MDHEREKNHLKEQYKLTADDLRKAERALKDTIEKYERAREAAEVFQSNEEVRIGYYNLNSLQITWTGKIGGTFYVV